MSAWEQARKLFESDGQQMDEDVQSFVVVIGGGELSTDSGYMYIGPFRNEQQARKWLNDNGYQEGYGDEVEPLQNPGRHGVAHLRAMESIGSGNSTSHGESGEDESEVERAM